MGVGRRLVVLVTVAVLGLVGAMTADSADPLVISPSTLPSATKGQTYSQTLTASGGTAPYSFSSANLPAWLTLASAGELTGTAPTDAGPLCFSFTIQATDSKFATGSSGYTVPVNDISSNAPCITTASVANASVGTTYSQELAVAGGTKPFTWSVDSGKLPDGLALSSAGAITGIPTAAGTANFTAKVTDDAKATATKALSVSVVAINPPTLPNGTVGSSYPSQRLEAIGFGAAITAWTVAGGSLPAGLTLDPATGVISGTPSALGTSSFSVTATDGTLTGVRAYGLTVGGALAITTSSLPSAKVGTAYMTTLRASGGTSLTWSITSGTLPAGLSLNASSGVISGTPTTATTASLTFQVADVSGATVTKTLTLTVGTNLTITTSTLPAASVGSAYSQTLAATGGTSPLTWSISAGTLPAGLSLDASTGVISGTPTSATTASLTVMVTDASGNSATKALTLKVSALFAIPTVALRKATVGVAYTQKLTATGGTPPYQWTLRSGKLPAGLSLSKAGVISGTPTRAGSTSFTVSASDSAGASATKSFTMTVAGTTTSRPPPPPPKKSGGCTVCGTPGDDVLRGTAGADKIDGRGGNDVIYGRGGDDVLKGGPGADRIYGGGGNDRLSGGVGADELRGGAGKDRLTGGKGRDRLLGNAGADALNAKDKTGDLVDGGPGVDSARVDRKLDRVIRVEHVSG